ncbi:MAG: cbb3-type cytochrome c oxidase subunit 3 [Candidatus Thiodiazotropha lotti]|uniref:Cbb3-type cytochrome c oxidase subunit 3 n=1 Tax=Candidatus Thiodiazotropha lotti TaxID=2792787 RepID=A0A9E4MZS6_9GAMM|nr:cbb3-type cytochrome c oxidase subunit 3 [Candidatus Thiodiazotropha lotti]MCG7921290.1 cbb3-type cytochrome c oxidase subunit 3 [Candidatus Thiodiazotropha lotti]MCG7930257.1 cbb3-type cytochrome c oxidase subunit 3 [Candidatus Thiodiazotropha lotti]MCG7939812.1 cbb3-type cytochrome c oxidase subunit 3 [Candidatus Thiodiazotropha lotti]MCG7982239.1 cbb3-type cytochrome c oxidase subunit 3 [Candidatus Thiodiazotropha lotti]
MKEYFSTNWEAMTTNDWIGMIMTVVTFFLMIGVYFYALRPKNKDKLEKNRFIPMDDDANDSGDKNGGK